MVGVAWPEHSANVAPDRIDEPFVDVPMAFGPPLPYPMAFGPLLLPDEPSWFLGVVEGVAAEGRMAFGHSLHTQVAFGQLM